jgi:hypothetical protein
MYRRSNLGQNLLNLIEDSDNKMGVKNRIRLTPLK